MTKLLGTLELPIARLGSPDDAYSERNRGLQVEDMRESS